MDLNGQLQLLGRLQGIGTDFDSHWKFLFRNKEPIKGPLCDFQTALRNSPFLYPAACAQPERISRLIDNGLKGATTEARKTITGNARWGLVRALEELLFHRETSVTAILNLGLLAEAEVENHANNATDIFCSYFFPVHPQAPWSFSERLEALERILSSDNSDELRRVGITAIESSLHHMAHPIIEHSSDAATPLEPPFEHLELQYLDYLEDLIDILMKIAGDENEVMLAEDALASLPTANVECMIPILRLTSPARRIERTVARFERLTRWATTGVRVSVSDLDAALKRCRNLLNEDIAKRGKIALSEIKNSPGFVEASDDELKEAADDVRRSINRLKEHSHQIQTLIKALDQAEFAIRLKKWIGATRRPAEYGRGAQRDELLKIPRSLANEALAVPHLLADDNELMAWLCSDEAKKADIFFEELGKLDAEHRFIDMIKRFGALDTRQSVENFASYFAGLNEADENFVSTQLDERDSADIHRSAGLSLWFAPRHPTSPSRWKMVLFLTVSIFIMAEIITPLLSPALRLLPQPLALFISLGIQIALLTYFVLPWLTALLAKWLYDVPKSKE